LLWTLKEFLADELTRRNAGSFTRLNGMGGRPFCAAFKPVAILRAFSLDTDYVLWTDSSRHVPEGLQGLDIHLAIRHLNARALLNGVAIPASVYGRLRCDYVGKGGVIPNSQLLLASTPFNNALVNVWMSVAFEAPTAFCRGHYIQDNAMWLILIEMLEQRVIVDSIRKPSQWHVFPSVSIRFLLESLMNNWFEFASHDWKECLAWLACPTSQYHNFTCLPSPPGFKNGGFGWKGTCAEVLARR
jgi:hypothetical protein